MCYKNNFACGNKPSDFHNVQSVQYCVITAERDSYAAQALHSVHVELLAQDSTISEV